MKAIPRFTVLTLAVIGLQAHAQGMSMPMENKPAAKASASSLPLVNAEVRKVNTENGTVVLKHEDIPNLGMMAMTMEFGVADKKMLAGLKAGDKVRFQADMVQSKAVVTKLQRGR